MVMVSFELSGGHHAQFALEPALVEPVEVLQGGVLHVLEPAPGTVFVDQLGLVETVERFGQGIDAPIERQAPRGLDVATATLGRGRYR